MSKASLKIKIESLDTEGIVQLPTVRKSRRISERNAREAIKTDAVTSGKLKKEETKSVKIKQEDKPLSLSGDSVRRRLQSYLESALSVPSTPELLTPILRSFISRRYGGGLVPMLPTTNKKKRELHGIERFAFLKAEYNPNMPPGLGKPGLAFRNPEDVVGCEPMPCFVQRGTNYWLYCGHYIFHESEPLSVEEWQDQARTVQDTWVGNYFAKLWPTHMSAPIIQKRIAKYMIEKERRLSGTRGRASPQEIDRFIRRGRCMEMNPDVLRQDLDSGTTRPPCCALECVEYDPSFQHELIEGEATPETEWRTFPDALVEKYRPKIEAKILAGRMKEEDVKDRKRRRGEMDVKVEVGSKNEKRAGIMVLDFVDVPPRKRIRLE